MKKIALVGFEGAGKSTLAYSLSKHLQKKGVRCETANFDASCKHIKYKPIFDVRKRYPLDDVMKRYGVGPNAALKRVYASLAKDAAVSRALNAVDCDVLLLDVEGPVELFLSDPSFLEKFADAALFVVDSSACNGLEARVLAALQRFKYGLPVFLVLNKADVSPVQNPQRSLSSFKEDKELRVLLEGVAGKIQVFRVSAMDRRGFDGLVGKVV